MATIKANKDKARFISNTISQDALDGDWVDHEVITKYKLPEIVVDASTTTTSLKSTDVITTGDKLKVYNATDGMVDRTAGTVTTVPLSIDTQITTNLTISAPKDIFVSEDGTKMFYINTSTLLEHTLSIPYDITSCTQAGSLASGAGSFHFQKMG